ncbi:hypothetical protein [Streptomyces avermitilis]|uniref:hypothetical protein n=1 Tax=Streptomyces avermitilis TaxID=33903 RepID=UPI00380BD9E7
MTARRRRLPSANSLTRAQFDGHACVWCGEKLWRGAQSAGRARGMTGKIPYDIEVYACPQCSPSFSRRWHSVVPTAG